MPEVEYKELPEGTEEANIVKPVKLANELDIRPQIVYGWIRNGGLPAYTRNGEGRYILRTEFEEWQAAKAQRKADRAAKASEKAAKKEAKDAEAGGEGEATDSGSDEGSGEEEEPSDEFA